MSAMKIQLGYIMIGIIGLFFIGYLVYSNVYQKKINKRLKRNESMTHISMVSAENVGKTLMLVGTIIIFILIMAKLSIIDSNIKTTNNNLISRINRLERQVEILLSEAEEGNSILNEFDLHFKGINTEDNTVETKITCIPKTVTENTSISVRIGEDTIALTRDDDVYTAVKNLPLFDSSCGQISVIVKDGGVKSTEKVSDDYDAFYETCLTYLSGSFGVHKQKFDGEYFSIKFSYGTGSVSGHCGRSGMSDNKLIFMIDNKVVETIDVSDGRVDTEKRYKADSDSSIKIIAEGVDEYGYRHRREIYNHNLQNGDAYMTDAYTPDANIPQKREPDTILDGNGNILAR